MGVAGAGEVFGGGTELHRDADLVDQIARHRADDMGPQYLAGSGLGGGNRGDPESGGAGFSGRQVPLHGQRPRQGEFRR